jgi:AraC-like DNA-binding protein
MHAMDALTDLLKTFQLSANTYFFRGVGCWNMQIQYRPQGLFYVVLKGQCYFQERGNEELLLLKEGDIVALLTGGNHWVCDSPAGRALSVQDVAKVGYNGELLLVKTGNIEALATGGEPVVEERAEETANKEIKLLCSTMSYDTSMDHPFLKDLPCFIHTSTHNDNDANGLKSFVKILEKESETLSPGSTLMVDRLTEMLTVQLLREHIGQMKEPNGYMAALSDPKIGVALNLIHTETDEKWTVDSLCKVAGLNRTSFTEKFVAMVGSTPKSYLTNTRMQKAKNSLQRSNDSMLCIAERAGYASEAAFSKAMKKHFNKTPGQIRKG